jgi:hypothetical protein
MSKAPLGTVVLRIDPQHLLQAQAALGVVLHDLGQPEPGSFVVGVLLEEFLQQPTRCVVVPILCCLDGAVYPIHGISPA